MNTEIGKTHYSFTDPATGTGVEERVTRCTDCHGEGSAGFQSSKVVYHAMHELAVQTARAERTLLAAQRGGVEVRKAHMDLDKAVDSQIQLQVLVHSFMTQTNSDFLQEQATGLDSARAALAAGDSALGEISYRRKGLLVSLGIILCVLIGLGLKIRELSHN